LSTDLLAGVKAGCIHLCWVSGNTVWSHMAGDTS